MDDETRRGEGAELGFGRRFGNHMAVARYDRNGGWADTEIVEFGDLLLSPAAMVFHYGQTIFEGLKAFRQPDGSVALFRPGDHAARFIRSARRMAMPALPVEAFMAACGDLARVDHADVPIEAGRCLYLRPMMIATEVGLGVRASGQYLFAVISSPVGSYFPGGVRPVTMWATPDFVRAAPGGTGSAKCGGNYAASLKAKEQAVAQGCDDTLWLDAIEHRWIEELGGMNIVFVMGKPDGRAGVTLVAPPIGDTILDGITRRSLLALGARRGYRIEERPVSIDEACDGRSFREAFACGTAAVVAPVGAIRSPSGQSSIGDGQAGPVTLGLRDALTGLQEGRADDPFGWRVAVTPAPVTPAAVTPAAVAAVGPA
jgi:branched-chain amino acid aminotransferase